MYHVYTLSTSDSEVWYVLYTWEQCLKICKNENVIDLIKDYENFRMNETNTMGVIERFCVCKTWFTSRVVAFYIFNSVKSKDVIF